MDRPTVLLTLAEDRTSVAASLEAAGLDALEIPLKSWLGDESPLGGRQPDLAVLDCDGDRAAVEAAYRHLHDGKRIPTLLLFTDSFPNLGEYDSSHDEYVRKPTPPEALVFRVQAMLIRSGRQVSTSWSSTEAGDSQVVGEGTVIAVFAPKGGVGKTTLSVNLAAALREQTRSSVLLFDADVGVGNVTSVLAVPYGIGLADLSQDEWTDAAFEQAAATHPSSGVQVLTWGIDPGQSELVSVDLMLAALRWARHHYTYVVVDTHPGYDDRTMAMLTVASQILLVVTPEVGPLKNAAQFLGLAREVGLLDNVQVVINRANHGIHVKQMAQTLGMPIAATIVSNGPKAVIAANEGVPLIHKFPKEQIAGNFHDVARVITQEKTAPVGGSARASRSWLSRIGLRAPSTSPGR